MGSYDLIIFIVISFCYHMLLSLGGLLPLVCDLEPNFPFVLSFIQGLPHMNPGAYTVLL